MSITIDQEGARRIAQKFHATSDPSALLAAFESAAAGDFTALAAIVGEAPAESAPAPAPDFRDGDVVRVAPDNLEAVVTGPPTAQHPTTARIAAEDGRLYDARLSDLRLVGRRHFRAGERCGTVAEGQRRVCSGAEPWPYVVGASQGDLISVTGDDGRTSRWPRIIVRDDLLASAWTAPEAVDVKP